MFALIFIYPNESNLILGSVYVISKLCSPIHIFVYMCIFVFRTKLQFSRSAPVTMFRTREIHFYNVIGATVGVIVVYKTVHIATRKMAE